MSCSKNGKIAISLERVLDIAEVAEKTGLAPSALRFYEKKGLLASSGRNGLRRTYEPEVLHRLELINCARRAGFSIAEIRRFLGATPADAAVRARMAEKVAELDEDIARLQRMRHSLQHASTCTHEPLVECPEFKQALAT
ncbi:DNA-binding transcriptional MerR regulator [Lentzea atacamensis]|uniref:DNA-binding transcriptional MerR regulator n=1 Tax=Lentzea atacamensis TaxID=531938 RepID=A0A316HSR7_9PSEU|nr:DNA-binding transcriptional MerR regulator [Lentzea atacamensis]